ncbi:MAG TPA: hypothetical protein VF803_00340 [Candidatus Paceibacterota bacterium]
MKLRGTSLLELIIYIGILSFVLLAATGSFTMIDRGRGTSETRSEVDSNIRFALDKMSQDVKAASAITTPAAAGGTGNTLVLTVSGNSITYSVSNNTLQRQVGAGTPDALTASSTLVQSLFVTRLENYNAALNATTISVRISLSAKYNSSSPDWQYAASATTTATLR